MLFRADNLNLAHEISKYFFYYSDWSNIFNRPFGFQINLKEPIMDEIKMSYLKVKLRSKFI